MYVQETNSSLVIYTQKTIMQNDSQAYACTVTTHSSFSNMHERHLYNKINTPMSVQKHPAV
jgi:hypothetical protein